MNRIAILFALFSLGFAALFVADLRGYFNSVQTPVAQLEASAGTVRRLPKDRLNWDRAQAGSLFGAGDTISTGEDARAKLVFYAGGEVELEAGSMVTLGGDLSELKLNFVSGTGRVRVAKNAKKKISVARVPAMAAAPRPKSKPKHGAESTAEPSTEVAALDMEAPEPETARVDVAVVEDLPPPSEPAPSSPAPSSAPAEDVSLAPTMALAPAIQEKDIKHEAADSFAAHAMSPKGELLSVAELPPVPEVKTPDDIIFDLGKQNAMPKLEWRIPEKAEASKPPSFEIVLKRDGKGEERILKSDRPSLTLTDMQAGRYLWSVRAVTAEGKRGPVSDQRWIVVKVPAKIARPVVLPVKVEVE